MGDNSEQTLTMNRVVNLASPACSRTSLDHGDDYGDTDGGIEQGEQRQVLVHPATDTIL